MPAISVFTNLDIQKRHEKLILWQRYYDDNGNPLPDVEERYPRYDNYMAINVDRVADIPVDYKPCWFKCSSAENCPFAQEKGMNDAPALCEHGCNGTMGVPITYMDKHNPDEFEIIQLCASHGKVPKGIENESGYINGKWLYARILIQKKKECKY